MFAALLVLFAVTMSVTVSVRYPIVPSTKIPIAMKTDVAVMIIVMPEKTI
jgi:hypothetical protein